MFSHLRLVNIASPPNPSMSHFFRSWRAPNASSNWISTAERASHVGWRLLIKLFSTMHANAILSGHQTLMGHTLKNKKSVQFLCSILRTKISSWTSHMDSFQPNFVPRSFKWSIFSGKIVIESPKFILIFLTDFDQKSLTQMPATLGNTIDVNVDNFLHFKFFKFFFRNFSIVSYMWPLFLGRSYWFQFQK